MRENLLGCKYIGVQGHGIFRELKLLGVIEIVVVRKSKLERERSQESLLTCGIVEVVISDRTATFG